MIKRTSVHFILTSKEYSYSSQTNNDKYTAKIRAHRRFRRSVDICIVFGIATATQTETQNLQLNTVAVQQNLQLDIFPCAMYNLNGNENEMNTASPNEITTTERRILGAG